MIALGMNGGSLELAVIRNSAGSQKKFLPQDRICNLSFDIKREI